MPTYDYVCRKCWYKELDVVQKVDGRYSACPACGAAINPRPGLIAPAIWREGKPSGD